MGKAFFFNLMGTGHLNPTLGVVTELVRRGEAVIYYAYEQHRESIVAAGATFRPYPVPLPTIEKRESGLHLALHKLQESLVAFPHLVKVVAEEQGDYVVFDAMAPLGKFIAERLGLPAIASNSSFAFTPESIRAFAPPSISNEEMIVRVAGPPHPMHLAQYEETAAILKAEYGLTAPAWLDTLSLTGDLTILYTSDAIQPAAHSIPGEALLVGPCLRRTTTLKSFPYELFHQHPLLYISLGTEFHNNADFYRRCVEAFNDAPYSVLLSIGREVAIEALGTIAPNITVTRFAPQLEVLRFASVFVTHGGMNSTNEALYYNVPLVMVPQGADQFLVTQQVVTHGAGVALDSSSMTADLLRHAVEQVMLTPSYRECATRMGASLRAAGGAAYAVDRIMRKVYSEERVLGRVAF